MPHVLSPLLREPERRWQLVNEARATPLATTLEVAFDSRSRRRGLLGRDGLPAGHALVIAPSNAIHTCFMRFPIDVAFIDRAGVVVGARHALPAWRLAAAWRAFAIVELSAGTLAATETRVGDRLAVLPRETG